MNLFSKMLLFNKVEEEIKEQHITGLTVARLNNLSCNEDFSEISIESQTGVTGTGYIYIYLDDTSNYRPFCYNTDGVTELNVTGDVGGPRYAVPFNPRNFEQGTYIFEGGIKEISTGKIVQTFEVTYKKVD